jgi:hypothetical protein
VSGTVDLDNPRMGVRQQPRGLEVERPAECVI